MRLIVIGCEYSGKSTFAKELVDWGKKNSMRFGLHDHFIFPQNLGLEDDQEKLLSLSPMAKEHIQRYQIYYHVVAQLQYSNVILVGFHIQEAVYAPLYLGYTPKWGWRRWTHKIESYMPPDTILLLLEASPETIIKRMEENPHNIEIIKKEDVPHMLERFEEEYDASLMNYECKAKINTTNLTARETLESFISLAREMPLQTRDLLRISRF